MIKDNLILLRTVTVSDCGQIVIPRQARDLFEE